MCLKSPCQMPNATHTNTIVGCTQAYWATAVANTMGRGYARGDTEASEFVDVLFA